LSIEQTAELAREQRNYDVTLESTRNTLASKGLSSSSIRNQAEERLGTSQEDIIESTKRSYARSLRAAELTKSRGLEDIEASQKWYERKAEESKTAAVKTAEQTFGTKELEGLGELGGLDLGDYTLGGVTGTIGADKISDIMSRANTSLFAQYY